MDNNPLKQYFRRPAVYIKLPSEGKLYSSDVVDMPDNGELPVYPMTAIDEITSRTPDALYNGSAVVELIKSCIPAIKDPWKLNSMDLDAVLLGIKAADIGNTLEIESLCPECDNLATYNVDIVNLLSQMQYVDYSVPLQINDLTIRLKPITYKEVSKAATAQFELERRFAIIDNIEDANEKTKQVQGTLLMITDLTMQILSEAIASIKTPSIEVDNKEYILDYLRNCDKSVYLKIRDHNNELRALSQIKPLHFKCVNSECQHEYDQPFTVNPSDFFG